MQSTKEELSLQNVAGFETHTSPPQEITHIKSIPSQRHAILSICSQTLPQVLELEQGLGCAAETPQIYFQNTNKEESLQLQRNYHFHTPAE